MHQKYTQVYTRRAKSTNDVLVVSVSLTIDTISSENVAFLSPSVDIDFCVDINSQSDFDIHIAHRKEKKELHTLHSLHNSSYAHLFM